MCGKFLKFVALCFFVFLKMFIFIRATRLHKSHDRNFSLLIDFTCAVAKDELEKHPEMRTIALIELENNFMPEFSQKISHCMPNDVAKVILTSNKFYNKSETSMPKESMIILIADKIREVNFYEKL